MVQETMMNNGQRSSFWLVIAGVLVLIGIAAAVYFTIATQTSRNGKVKVDLFKVPPDAKVYVDDKPVTAKAIYLQAGEHIFRAELEGFETINSKQNITEPKTVRLALTPISQEAISLAKKYQSEYLEAEGLAGDEANRQGEEIRQKNPIISVLPYRGTLFNIDYRLANDSSDRIVVQISASSPESRSFAIERIRSLGYEPSDYELEFLNLPNNSLLE